MTRHDLLTAAAAAFATALVTLTLALPAQLNAVDPAGKPKPENQTPKLTVDGVEMALKVVSQGDLTKGPSLQLVATNTTQTVASIKSAVAMLDRNDVMATMSRMGPRYEPSYSSEQPIELSAGETRTFTIDMDKPVAAGHSVRFDLKASGKAVSVAGFTVPGIDAAKLIGNSGMNLTVNGNTVISLPTQLPAAAPATQPSAAPVAQRVTAKSAS